MENININDKDFEIPSDVLDEIQRNIQNIINVISYSQRHNLSIQSGLGNQLPQAITVFRIFANSDDKHYYIVFKSVGVHQTLNTFDKYIESLDTNIESDCSQHDYPLWYVQCFFQIWVDNLFFPDSQV